MSDELMVNDFSDMLSQKRSGVADHLIFFAFPRGFVTIVGSARVIGVSI